MHAERFVRLYNALSSSGFDALALNPGSSLTYLTGLNFHLMERPTILLVVPGQTPALVLPELEIIKARSAPVELHTFTYSDTPSSWPSAFLQACEALDLDRKTIGVEPARLRFLELSYLQGAMPKSQFKSAADMLDSLRMQKGADEIAAMRKAVHIAQQALQATLPAIKPGATEKQIAAELVIQLLKAGTDPELPFQPIVSGGPHSADPHASPSNRPLQNGDLLVIDWGATYQGYISDLTRTFAIGKVEPEFERIAELVSQANEKGRAFSRPGITAGEVDKAARKVIADGGYGQYFFHRTGHGIGMEAHEPPYIFGQNELILAPGMTYTVEPGVYLPGRGGVRIEDNVVITDEGSESLSNLPRSLIHLR